MSKLTGTFLKNTGFLDFCGKIFLHKQKRAAPLEAATVFNQRFGLHDIHVPFLPLCFRLFGQRNDQYAIFLFGGDRCSVDTLI